MLKKPLIQRIRDTLFLLKNSFSVMGKDRDIITPTKKMAILSVFITTIVFGIILSFLTGKFIFTSILILLFVLPIIIIYRFFYNIRQKACQSWIVYNTITGKDISYSDSIEHVKQERSSLRKIAFIDILVSYVGSQGNNNQRRGISAIIVSILLSALVEVWDLLSNYMIPAVVIEQKSLKQIIPELKALKRNIPATLVGVFGIDFVGNVLTGLLIPIYLLLIIISAGIGYLMAPIVPNTVFTLAEVSFSWIPIFVALYLGFVFGGILKAFVQSVKIIYFTIFYTALTRSNKLSPSIRREVTNYLTMKG